MNQNKNKGFTLIEMMIVIAIIGLLATIVIVNVMSSLKSGRDRKRQADVNQIALAASLFIDKNGCFPGSDNCAGATLNWKDDLKDFIDLDKVQDPLHPDHKYDMQLIDLDGDKSSYDNCVVTYYSETLDENINKNFHKDNPDAKFKPAYCRN